MRTLALCRHDTLPPPRRLPALEALDRLILALCQRSRFPGPDPAELGLGLRGAALAAAEALIAGCAGSAGYPGGPLPPLQRVERLERLQITAHRLREVGFYIEAARRLGYLPRAVAAELLEYQLRASFEVTALTWSLGAG